MASTAAVPKEGTDSMGRRIFILPGILLLLACPRASVPGQVTEPNHTQEPVSAPLPPITPAEGDLNGATAEAPPSVAEVPTQERDEASQDATKKDATKTKAGSKGGQMVPSAPTDPELNRAQAIDAAGAQTPATSPPPGTAPAPATAVPPGSEIAPASGTALGDDV